MFLVAGSILNHNIHFIHNITINEYLKILIESSVVFGIGLIIVGLIKGYLYFFTKSNIIS